MTSYGQNRNLELIVQCTWRDSVVNVCGIVVIIVPNYGVALTGPWMSAAILLSKFRSMIYRQTSNISHFLVSYSRQYSCWSFRCSWSMTCWCCSTYIFIQDLTTGFNGLGQNNCKTRLETCKFLDLVQLILEIWQYIELAMTGLIQYCSISFVPICSPSGKLVTVINLFVYFIVYMQWHNKMPLISFRAII